MRHKWIRPILPISLVIVVVGLTLDPGNPWHDAHAQVAPITPSDLGTQVSDPIAVGGQTQYDITGGTRPGGGPNLFHSFGEFGIPTNNIANFLNGISFDLNGTQLAPGLQTSNILARVTGTNGNNPTLSSIYGTLQTSDFGNANLFLMNPAGFLFGPNATVNVGGMVAFTSADYLKLTDNARFNSIPNSAADALLTALPVASFGFLGSNPGAITVQGSQFSVTDGQSISFVGGNISIESGTPDGGTAQPARLSAPNGNILMASVASPGEFDAVTLQSLPNVDGASFSSFGSVRLTPGSSVDVTGTNTISIRGGQFVLTVNDAVLTTAETGGETDSITLARGSSVITSNDGTDPGADVGITAGVLQLDAALVTSRTTGESPGGALSITAQSINLTNGSQIASIAEELGAGGAITIAAVESFTASGFDTEGTSPGVLGINVSPDTGLPLVTSGIFTTTMGSGPGGQITMTAGDVSLNSLGTFTSIASGDGQGGNITLNVQNITVQNGGWLMSAAGADFTTLELMGSGRGGDINVTAEDSIRVSESNPDLIANSVMWSASFNTGDGGNIKLSAQNISVDQGGMVQSTSDAIAKAGDIRITTHEQLSVSGFDPMAGTQSQIISSAAGEGTSGTISVTARSVDVSDLAMIQTIGNRSDIMVLASQDVSVTGGGLIAAVGGPESSGDIALTADSVLISGSQAFSRSRIENINIGEGKTGDIAIQAREVLVTDNARINSEGTGRDGNILLSATESVTVSDGAKVRMANASGPGGLVQIAAPFITLTQGIIQTLTSGVGDAGAIMLQGNTIALNGGQINSQTEQIIGRGGDVTITASDRLSITGQFAGSASDPSGPAGIFSRTANFAGDAGTIAITAGSMEMSGGTRIDSSTSSLGSDPLPPITTESATGNGGPISITVANTMSLLGQGTGLYSETSGSWNGGAIDVHANEVQLSDGAIISAKSTGSGAAGNVTIENTSSPTQSILIDGFGSGILTSTEGTGAGGNITLNANTVTLQNGSTLSAATSGTSAAATGGTIMLEANQVQLNNGGLVTASTTGAGAGGSITVGADSTFVSNASAVQTTASQASGGNIDIIAGQLVALNNGSLITANSTGAGNAGNILINAGQNYISTDSAVTTQAAQASGGNITVLATDTVQLTNSQLNASVQGSSTTVGGNITIDPLYVIFQNSQILAQATQGQGGAISITITSGGLFLPDANSVISASSQFGVNGTVTIQSPNAPGSGKIQPLGKTPLEATSLLNQHCAALAGGEFSSFTVAGRNSLPTEPSSWLASPLYAAGVGLGIKAEGVKAEGERLETPLLSLRQIAPAGFLTQAFAVDWSAGCQS